VAQRQSVGGTFIWALSILALGLVWGTIAAILPSQHELTSSDTPRVSAASVVSSPPVPALDLTVPISPPLPPETPSAIQPERPATVDGEFPSGIGTDESSRQVIRLKCEAEIEQLCPASDGPTRRQCIEQRAQRLPAPCQHLLRERVVKWKEERMRMVAACQDDVKRFCPAVTPGSGQVLQCLQEHAQNVSDQCYQTLPKGTVYFKH
jgi:hypothetical protein